MRIIDIRNNNISSLPDSICDLNILWKLRADFNQLSELPFNIGRLSRLEVLTLSNNNIKSLPKSLFQIGDKMGMLTLNDNKISNISRGIGNLRKLRIFLIHNNLIS